MKPASNRPGIAFQNLVATLERVLSARPGVEIFSPHYIRDKDTGAQREHDVVIKWKDAHHVRLTAIECKDTGRKVGVPQVEAFAKKCEKTGIHHAVIVSSRGFTKSAGAKAKALDVDLMMLRDVERFEWMATDFVVGYHRQFNTVDIHVECAEGVPEGAFKIINQDGDEVPFDKFAGLINANLDEPDDMNALVGKTTTLSLRFLTPGLTAVDERGHRFEVAALNLQGSYTVEKRRHDVRSHAYTGNNADYALVSTDLSVSGREGKLIFVRDDEGIRVVWQPL